MDPYKQFKQECSNEIEAMGRDTSLTERSLQWLTHANEHKYSYHFEWMGRPVIQYPQDMVAVQELIWQIKPDLVIETGIAHGGSLILSASILALLDLSEAIEKKEVLDPTTSKRKVLGLDIDIREYNRQAILEHPMSSRIEMLEGSSTDPSIVSKVHEIASGYNTILIFLDSNHTHDHVLEELECYAQLTTPGSYCVVFDTVIEDLPESMFENRPWSKGNNAKTAVWEYLKTHPEFEIDHSIQNKLQITVAPDGYLKRIQ